MEHDCQSMTLLNQSDVISALATQLGTSMALHHYKAIISSYKVSSTQNEDFIGHTPITIEEIEATVARLKRGVMWTRWYLSRTHSLWRFHLQVVVSENLLSSESSHNPFSIPSLSLSTRGREGIHYLQELQWNFSHFGYWETVQRLIPVIGVPHYTQTAY